MMAAVVTKNRLALRSAAFTLQCWHGVLAVRVTS